jgi:hypothetical protein
MHGVEGGIVGAVDAVRIVAQVVGKSQHHPVTGDAEILEAAERGCGLDEFRFGGDAQCLNDPGDSGCCCGMRTPQSAKLPSRPVSIPDGDQWAMVVMGERAADNGLICTWIESTVRL